MRAASGDDRAAAPCDLCITCEPPDAAMTDRFETPLAILQRVTPRRVEIRFKPAVTIHVAGLVAIFQERKRMQGNDPVSLLVVIPPDAEREIAVPGIDQFARNDGA